MALPTNRPNIVPDPEGDKTFLEENLAPKDGDITDGLSKHIEKVWAENQKNFKPVRREMVETYNRIKGEYDPDKLAAIRAFRGSEAYLRVGENKARAAESWLKDIYRGDVDIPWALEPTAEPELPDETMQEIEQKVQQQVGAIEQQLVQLYGQLDPTMVADMLQQYYEELIDKGKDNLRKEAKERCERQSSIIRDQNQEGGWDAAFKDFLYFLTRMKFGIIKGPILVKKKKQTWVPIPEGGYKLELVDSIVNDVYSPSPFNFYPSYGMKHINDGNVIEVHEMTPSDIADLIGVPSYSEEKIRIVLKEIEKGSLKGKWFTIDDETMVTKAIQDNIIRYDSTPATQNSALISTDKVLAQEFWGAISGKVLMEWGIKEQLDPEMQYQANCWKIGKHVIKAVINPDAFGRKPYHITSWAKNPHSIVGEGLLEFAAPIEDCINAITRALINNIAIASGPMAEIDKDRVDLKVPIYPWRQIESTSMQMKNDGAAVKYYQPQMHSGELIQAWEFFGKVLDEMTVPAYAQGMSQSGVTAGTATVFTQLLAAATRSIKSVASNIDDDIITPYIEMHYDFLIQNTTDPMLQGDTKVVAKGVAGLQAREQQAQRKIEYLQVAMTPVLSQILGAKNLGALAAQIAKSNDIILPDMKRLDGGEDMQMKIEQMIMAGQGIDPSQENGQMSNGGGAPSKPQAVRDDGARAGIAT